MACIAVGCASRQVDRFVGLWRYDDDAGASASCRDRRLDRVGPPAGRHLRVQAAGAGQLAVAEELIGEPDRYDCVLRFDLDGDGDSAHLAVATPACALPSQEVDLAFTSGRLTLRDGGLEVRITGTSFGETRCATELHGHAHHGG